MKKDYYEIPVISNNHGEKKTKMELLDHNPSQPDRVRTIDLKWENEICYEKSEYKAHYNFNNLFFQRIKKFCKIFSHFLLVGTTLIVSHGKMISLYSILSRAWMQHFYFDHSVRELFRNGKNIEVTVYLDD